MYKRIKNARKYKARFKGVIIVGMHIKYKCCRTTELTNEMTNEMSNEMSNEMTNEMLFLTHFKWKCATPQSNREA